MSNSYFQFKQFTVHQDRCAMKVTTDGCLFGAWVAGRAGSSESIGLRLRRIADGDAGALRMLDIGTGTGLLSLMIAQKNEFSIDAIEMDQDAFQQACENVEASPWADRIKVFHADIREFEFPGPYDVIISNPPFYEKELKGDDVKKNVAHHNEGLQLSQLFSVIKGNLKPGGTFYLLLPFKRNEEIRKLVTGSDLAIRQLTFARQSTRHNFFRVMLEGKIKSGAKIETAIDEVAIKNDSSSGTEDQYTPEFINLLKDYYLHL